jgi:predicted acyl esterase
MIDSLTHGINLAKDVMVPMRDGVRLATHIWISPAVTSPGWM